MPFWILNNVCKHKKLTKKKRQLPFSQKNALILKTFSRCCPFNTLPRHILNKFDMVSNKLEKKRKIEVSACILNTNKGSLN